MSDKPISRKLSKEGFPFADPDNVPESEVGDWSRHRGRVAIRFKCASCGWIAGDISLPMEPPDPSTHQPDIDPFTTPMYQAGRGVFELDDGAPGHRFWIRCRKCLGPNRQPRELVLSLATATEALTRLRVAALDGSPRVVDRPF